MAAAAAAGAVAGLVASVVGLLLRLRKAAYDLALGVLGGGSHHAGRGGFLGCDARERIGGTSAGSAVWMGQVRHGRRCRRSLRPSNGRCIC